MGILKKKKMHCPNNANPSCSRWKCCKALENDERNKTTKERTKVVSPLTLKFLLEIRLPNGLRGGRKRTKKRISTQKTRIFVHVWWNGRWSPSIGRSFWWAIICNGWNSIPTNPNELLENEKKSLFFEDVGSACLLMVAPIVLNSWSSNLNWVVRLINFRPRSRGIWIS